MRGIEFYTTHFLICGNIDGKEKRGCKPSFSAKIHIERKDFIMKKTINKTKKKMFTRTSFLYFQKLFSCYDK